MADWLGSQTEVTGLSGVSEFLEGSISGADLHGDPLPSGASVRLGTRRFRHGDLVPAVAFSPDGLLVATGSHDRSVRVWDVGTGEEKVRLEGHEHWVSAVAFGPNGLTLASSSAEMPFLLCVSEKIA